MLSDWTGKGYVIPLESYRSNLIDNVFRQIHMAFPNK